MKYIVSLPLYLTIVFVVIRLFGFISWSWWWIVSPMWIAGAIVYLMLFLFVGLLAGGSDKNRPTVEDMLD